MSEKKKKAAPKAAPKPAAKLKVDRPKFGAPRVHTAEVDLATAVRMQACGYRVERSGDPAIVYGDAEALARWQAQGRSGGRRG